jgi:hypothetical protein
MANNSTTQLAIKPTDYVSFDALTLRQLIVSRLNEQQIFTDQAYIGSNLSTIIDIVSFAYNTLIYYLNRTSSESLFTEAQIYENINKIVKLLDYKPVGIQTATLSIQASATDVLPKGTYTIPRYSNILTNRTVYSFNEDITFIKQGDSNESLEEVSYRKLMFQGTYVEYPLQTAIGTDNETFTILTKDLVDYFNIDVYVKPKASSKYRQYLRTDNLFYENATVEKYEVRLNENKQIEIKFGNDINGSKLKAGDEIQIYYLASLGTVGEVGAGAFSATSLNKFNTTQFNTVFNDLQKPQANYLTTDLIERVVISNTQSSTAFTAEETVDSIKANAPKSFRTSNRLVTIQDFETYLKTTFSYFMSDVKVINNFDYLSTYIKYYYDLGLNKLDNIVRPLYNQVYFADACNFNNIYFVVVPKTQSSNVTYLQPGQKEFIINKVQDKKLSTAEVVFVDPVYKAISFGIPKGNISSVDDTQYCKLVLVKDAASSTESGYVKDTAIKIIQDFFSPKNNKLGSVLDLKKLLGDLSSISGIKSIRTYRTDTQESYDGLSFFVWNPNYPDLDVKTIYNSYKLQDFEFPYFYNLETIADLISVESSGLSYQVLNY